MDFLSHTVNRSELEPGDHIYVYRTLGYSHHGIYVGGDKVVHFGLNSNNSSSIFSSSISSSSGGGSGGGGRVVMTCLNCFLKSGSLRRYQYEVSTLTETRAGCTTQKSDPPRTVIARALYLLQKGFGKYNLLKNNCEVFALYCKTGLIVGRQTVPVGQAAAFVSMVANRYPRYGKLIRRCSGQTEPCASADTMDFETVDILLSAEELQGIACASCLPSN